MLYWLAIAVSSVKTAIVRIGKRGRTTINCFKQRSNGFEKTDNPHIIQEGGYIKEIDDDLIEYGYWFRRKRPVSS